MKTRGLVLVAAALLVAAAVVLVVRGRSPERQVRRRLTTLAERFSKAAGESNSTMALKMYTFSDLFLASVTLDLADFAGNGTYSSSEIGSQASRVRRSFNVIKLDFGGMTVRLDGEAARASLTADLRIEERSGEVQRDIRELVFDLRHDGDEWRIGAVREVRVMER